MGQLALLATLFAPFLGAVVLLFVPNREPLLVRAVAVASAGTALLASLYVFLAYDPDQGGFQFITKWAWSEELGIGFHIGVDGIGAPWFLHRPFYCLRVSLFHGTSRIAPRNFISSC